MNDRFDCLRLDNQLCFPLYAAAREVVKRYHPFLSELDLTYTQYIVLMVLWEEKQVSVKGLGERLHLDSGTLTPLLKSLEKKGLVTRTRSREDERFLVVEITAAGEALKEAAAEIPGKVSSCVHLNAEDASQLYSLLYKILDGMED